MEQLHIADCYDCENFFPNMNCRLGGTPFVKLAAGSFSGKRLRRIRCKQRGEVCCSEYAKHIKQTQLTLF